MELPLFTCAVQVGPILSVDSLWDDDAVLALIYASYAQGNYGFQTVGMALTLS